MTLDDRTLDDRLAALPRQADPDGSTWQAIESRIAPKQQQWFGRIAGGLAVAASLAVVLLVTMPQDSTPTRISEWVISSEIEAMRHQVSWADVPQPDVINAGLTTAWSENEQAIAELEQALARNPDNLMLMEFLAQARLRQSELIHQATSSTDAAQTWSL
ncbi:hypothetical protein IC757_03595 [Wenzhouxiangella sp. AB-CW3]|uniref:hypothetical protein n=1 Tax=Wenzhouxiangella sp. AB-CW3 TaxID=2771012 RepID=UPI00168AF319|nr:hypothetical protein [Wenzhouxiangella sp. AB-CW3]QOC23247.1 hypothetical protein IC757_03595 [Wenzhouxiangella sp. AB-CW3]